MFRRKRLQETVARLPQLWDQDGIGALPRVVLMAVADQRRLGMIHRMERPLMGYIEEDVLANGIREPLEVVCDPGRVRLRDGHHRLLVAEKHDIEWMPVFFSSSERITTDATPIVEFLAMVAGYSALKL